DETQAREIGDRLMDLVEQSGERCSPAITVHMAIVIDRLTEERYLARAGIDELAHLIDDVLRRTMHLRAARIGDHAVRAELVAPARDADVRVRKIVSRRDAAREIEQLEMIF